MRNRPLNIRYFRAVITLAFYFLALPVSAAEEREGSPTESGRLYLPSASAMDDVNATLTRAADSGRLALIALGANWCHDSRALAARLHSEPLASLVGQRYEIVFVDVGHVDKGTDVVTRFGVPGYYATPTVLIVDPETERVVNAHDRHRWANAERIGMEESVAYFEKMAADHHASPIDEPSAEGKRLEADIAAFEQRMAQRVREGYAVISPLLKAYVEDSEPENFRVMWDELSDLRMALGADLDKLRDEARTRVARGETGIELEFPDYPPFSWEEPARKQGPTEP
jgi:thiol-disulfide isomerase/thioredoxin